MGRKGLVAVLVGTALAVSGCGTVTAGGMATPTPISAARASGQGLGGGAPDSTDPLAGPAFPLTLRRTGGIAGFDDTIVLEANGKVHVDTRSIRGRLCTLTAPQRKQLLGLLGTLSLDNAATSTASQDGTVPDTGASGDGSSDPIVIALTDHNARPVDLSDPSLGEVASLVGSLVTDVTLSSPATTRCVTPTSQVPAPSA